MDSRRVPEVQTGTDPAGSCPEDRLVPALLSDRPAAPDDVWNWPDYRSWRDTVWQLMSDVLDGQVRSEFRRRPPKYVVGDDLTWLDRIVARVSGQEADIKALTADRLAAHFHALRACHATRTDDVGRYHAEGLQPLDPARVRARAAEVFLTGEFPELGPADLDRAVAEVGCDLREGRVWFEANERGLVGDAGHYLLYGGEYLIAIAAHLGRARDYRQILKRVGRPTMFVCDVPLRLIGGHTVASFAGTALEWVFEELLDPDGFRPDPHRGAGFCIHRALAPDHIVGHYHPTRIRDPFRGFGVSA